MPTSELMLKMYSTQSFDGLDEEELFGYSEEEFLFISENTEMTACKSDSPTLIKEMNHNIFCAVLPVL